MNPYAWRHLMPKQGSDLSLKIKAKTIRVIGILMALTAMLIFFATQSPQGTPGCTYGRYGSCPALPGIGLPVFLLEAALFFGGLLLFVLSNRLSGETEDSQKSDFGRGMLR